MSVKDHLADINFKKREHRGRDWQQEFDSWLDDLNGRDCEVSTACREHLEMFYSIGLNNPEELIPIVIDVKEQQTPDLLESWVVGTMCSSILWLLMSKPEYDKYMKHKRNIELI